MHTKAILATGILALTLTFGADQPVLAGPFLPGEILVDEFGSSSIQRYSATGSLLQTFPGTDAQFVGASLTPDGNLVTTFRNSPPGIAIFNPSGTLITSFFAGPNSAPGDVSVFADGTLAVNGIGNDIVQFFSQAGALLQTVSLPGITTPFGSTVGSDGILYVAGLTSNNLARVSSGGVSLGNVSLGFAPGDLVMNPVDGTLWVSGRDNNLVEHITITGTVLGSFATGFSGLFDGIGLAPDDNSLYVTSKAAPWSNTSTSVATCSTPSPSPAQTPRSS